MCHGLPESCLCPFWVGVWTDGAHGEWKRSVGEISPGVELEET